MQKTMDFEDRTKRCSKCGEVKGFTAFNKNRSKRYGLDSCCRACRKHHYHANIDRERARMRRNSRKRRQESPEKVRESDRAFYRANREQKVRRVTAWREANPDKVAEYNQAYERKKAAEQSARVRRIVPLILHFEGRHTALERLGAILAKRKDFDDLCYISADIEWLNVHYVAKEEPLF